MPDIFQHLLAKLGLWRLFALLLAAVTIIWGLAHWNAQPGKEVSVLWGLVSYTKSALPRPPDVGSSSSQQDEQATTLSPLDINTAPRPLPPKVSPEGTAEQRDRAQAAPSAQPKDPKPQEVSQPPKSSKSETTPKPKQPDDAPTSTSDKKASVEIVSINQTGGITAGEVNIASSPPPRRITSQDKPRIVVFLSGNPGRVSVSAIANDPEAYRFAQDWHEVLTQAGWDMQDQSYPLRQASRITSLSRRVNASSSYVMLFAISLLRTERRR